MTYSQRGLPSSPDIETTFGGTRFGVLDRQVPDGRIDRVQWPTPPPAGSRAGRRQVSRVGAVGEFFGLPIQVLDRTCSIGDAAFCHARIETDEFFLAGKPAPVSRFAGPITVVTGSCLLPYGTVRWYTADGDTVPYRDVFEAGAPLAGVVADECLSLYEAETVLRLSRVITRLGLAHQVVLDVPREQYYLTIAAIRARREVSAETAAAWCELVDRRHRLLVHAFRVALGVNAPVALALSGVGELLRESTVTAAPIDLRSVHEMLRGPEPMWRLLGPAADLHDLQILSYVATLLPRPGQATLMVDSPSERKLVRRAREFSPNAPLAALFAMEQFRVAGRGPFQNLYYGDIGRVFHDEAGNSFDTAGLLAAAGVRPRSHRLAEVLFGGHDPEGRCGCVVDGQGPTEAGVLSCGSGNAP
ncbi:hypothetical protein [Nocardia brevicatena]|uniref:hypothetical protein n=1 Tax=Nocardia brevicatena TaxID=37327 RepID=UPI001C3F3215|nr:hypothetical protein [Nocardia brevicatena]